MGLHPVWRLVECICVSWSDDDLGDVSRRIDPICDKKSLLKVLDEIQHGGKSITAENYVIGWFELGLAQGFQKALFVKNGQTGQKLITLMHVQI